MLDSRASTDPDEVSLLLEFAALWRRGLADERKLWQLFDVAEMYLQRPDYFGAPVLNTGNDVVSPVFSSQERLGLFLAETGLIDIENPDDGYDWARLTGSKFFGLPVRARHLLIDPGTENETSVDLSLRSDPPPLANNAPTFAVNLELQADGSIVGGLPSPELPDREIQ